MVPESDDVVIIPKLIKQPILNYLLAYTPQLWMRI